MICFKCGRLGHKEDACRAFEYSSSAIKANDDTQHIHKVEVLKDQVNTRPEMKDKYGAWMLVQKQGHKAPS